MSALTRNMQTKPKKRKPKRLTKLTSMDTYMAEVIGKLDNIAKAIRQFRNDFREKVYK